MSQDGTTVGKWPNPLAVLRRMLPGRRRDEDAGRLAALERELPPELLALIDGRGDDEFPPALARRRAGAVSSSDRSRRAGMGGRRDNLMPEEGDPSEDGHPCEAALEFRRLLRCWGMADEVPADVLDLCVSLAWIGKAVSRTEAVYEFRDMGVDPNTWQIIAGMAADDAVARRAMAAATQAAPDSRRGADLVRIRQSEGFLAAHEAVARAMTPSASGTKASRRWTYLRTLSDGMIRVEPPKPPSQVVDLAAARRRLADRRES